jgi:hypothetical protein
MHITSQAAVVAAATVDEGKKIGMGGNEMQ